MLSTDTRKQLDLTMKVAAATLTSSAAAQMAPLSQRDPTYTVVTARSHSLAAAAMARRRPRDRRVLGAIVQPVNMDAALTDRLRLPERNSLVVLIFLLIDKVRCSTPILSP